MSTLSIILPVYNKERYLSQTLDSILSQRFTDFELLLINDGSSDGSGTICEKYARCDTRIKLVHQLNQGVSSARNKGLSLSIGEYIGFVDADDIIDPEMYAVLIHNAQIYNADISCCGVKRFHGEKTTSLNNFNTIKVFNREEALKHLFRDEIALSNYEKIYRRETAVGISFPPALYEDTAFNFFTFDNASTIVVDPTSLYYYYIRDNSHSVSSFGYKHMNVLQNSKAIYNHFSKEPQLTDSAAAFDFNTASLILNIALISPGKISKIDHAQIMDRIKYHGWSILLNSEVRFRYKIARLLVWFPANLYGSILYLWSAIWRSDHWMRRKNAPTVQNFQ